MDDLDGTENNKLETNQVNGKTEPKTKEYILRAARNYRNRRKAVDKEFKERLNEFTRIYKEKNRDKVNEYHRNYMREYRAKKKAAAAAASTANATSANPDQQESIKKEDKQLEQEPIEAATAAIEGMTLTLTLSRD
jgi:hypothetical protein